MARHRDVVVPTRVGVNRKSSSNCRKKESLLAGVPTRRGGKATPPVRTISQNRDGVVPIGAWG